MDTNKLETFLTFSKTLNVRKTAELMNLTPSAVSKILANLEKDLEIKLTIPEGRNLKLTREAKLFAKDAFKIVLEWKNIKNNIKSEQAKQLEAPLRLATFEVFSTYFLKGLENINWEKGLKLFEANPGDIEKLILEDQADVGITYLPVPHPKLDFLKVATIEMGVFIKKGSFKNVAQHEIPFVIPLAPLNGTPTRAKGLDGWPESAYDRIIKYEVTLLESALELCRQGRCAGYFPKFIIEEHNKKIASEFSLERKFQKEHLKSCYSDVYIVKRKNSLEDDVIKKVSKMVRLTCSI
jgi:DNA-binding transcriptional LysR family regulator